MNRIEDIKKIMITEAQAISISMKVSINNDCNSVYLNNSINGYLDNYMYIYLF